MTPEIITVILASIGMWGFFVAGYMLAKTDAERNRLWVGLTEEERKNIMIECESTGDWAWELNAAHAIEAKLKEKNT